MKSIKNYIFGIVAAGILAILSQTISSYIPYHLISGGVFAMLIGMMLHPLLTKTQSFDKGLTFVSKKVLKGSIVLMGASLSFAQVFQVGKYSLIVMTFTLLTAYGFGNLFGKLFKMNWKLSNLISTGTGICGGSAIAALSPTIEAENSDIAYAISATFLFDIVMVVLFPLMGRYFGMSDLGFGLWAGTAVNDTSSVVAAGYAFSDVAGNYAVIVKLTRTLAIVPIVIIFSYVNQLVKKQKNETGERQKVQLKKIFPWFILLFLGMVALRSLNIVTPDSGIFLSKISKFCMVMSLGAIGLKTDFNTLKKSGFMPMLHGFIISALVVIVSFLVQNMLGQM